jgi:hypothetical protein
MSLWLRFARELAVSAASGLWWCLAKRAEATAPLPILTPALRAAFAQGWRRRQVLHRDRPFPLLSFVQS